MGYYDIKGARTGIPSSTPVTSDERNYKRQIAMIRSAEAANYDGSVEFYNQTKALAMQLGIPIKEMKTSAARKMGVGAYSLLDTALLGLLPNTVLQPTNEGERVASSIGSVGGMLLPWGMPAKLARGAVGAARGMAKGGQGAWKGFGEGFGRYGWNPMGQGSGAIKQQAQNIGGGGIKQGPIMIGPKSGPAGTGGVSIKVPPGGFGNTGGLGGGINTRKVVGSGGTQYTSNMGLSASEQIIQMARKLDGLTKAETLKLAQGMGLRNLGRMTKAQLKQRIIEAAASLGV